MTKSKGLGDSIEKALKATGIDKVAKKVLGDDCGCEERKEALNTLLYNLISVAWSCLLIVPFIRGNTDS